MGYKWQDAEDIIRKNTKEEIEKDNDEDEIYLMINKARENDRR